MAGKPTRLSKAAREFNVGTSTIVDLLNEKGHVIESSPNTKLNPELYEILRNEFASDKTVKEEASKRELSFIRRQAVEADAQVKEKVEPKKVEPGKDDKENPHLFIKDSSIDSKQSTSDETSENTSVPEKKETIEPATAKVKDAKSVTETPAPKKAAPEPKKSPIKPKIQEPAKPEPVQEEPVQEKKAEVIKVKVKKTPPATEKSPKPATPEAKKESAPVKTEKETPKVTPEPVPEKSTADADAEKTEAKSESPRVLGHVDLEGMNTRTRPVRKSKEEKQKDREDRKKKSTPIKGKTQTPNGKAEVKKGPKADTHERPTHKPVAKSVEKPVVKGSEKPAEKLAVKKTVSGTVKDPNFLETKFEKLSGPKVVDKIDLSQFATKPKEKRKPVASSSDTSASKKKKRKRITKPGAPGQNQQGGANARPRTPGSTSGGAGGKRTPGSRPPFRKDFKRGGPRKDIKKVDPTPEEIQKQIKETLNKLTGTNKSNKSKHRRDKRQAVHQKQEKETLRAEAEKQILTLTEFVTANEIAQMMDIPVNKVIATCMSLGLFVSINQRMDAEAINVVADEFGYSVEFVSAEVVDTLEEEENEAENTTPRAPIVTVMGHVDHGKTKLLDHIRKTNVVAGEAGGITQHIGAYEVKLPNEKRITFLDTPGHEAFTAMRARGAKITDIAIIVIAADDNVMPQTVEAISHAQAANVPIVFAINKIDRPSADPERIKGELANMNILVEDWGGKFQSQDISAKEGINIEALLEKVLLEAEMLDLKCNPERVPKGTVLESRLDRGRGYVTNILVQNGTLRLGEMILAGSHFGKIKAMYNERGQQVKIAGPSAPVLVLGLDGAPQAGDLFKVMKEDREAKIVANRRLQLQREQGLRTQKHITLDEIGRRIAIGDFKELNLIVKGDVDGSIEALSDSLLKLSTEEVQVNVIHKSVGQVSESDVLLASASNAIILGFQVRPSVKARKLAEAEQIDIRMYSIIYKAIDEIKSAIEGMLSPEIQEKITCNIEIRETFKITKVGTIAGCMVLDGSVNRNTHIRVIRDGIVLHSGNLGSLKRFKDDVKEVKTGYECGLNIEKFNDIKVGDIIEGFEQIEIKRTLG